MRFNGLGCKMGCKPIPTAPVCRYNGAMQRVHSLLLRAARRRGFLMPVQVCAVFPTCTQCVLASRGFFAAAAKHACCPKHTALPACHGTTALLPRCTSPPCLPCQSASLDSLMNFPHVQTQKSDLKETTFIQHPVECGERAWRTLLLWHAVPCCHMPFVAAGLASWMGERMRCVSFALLTCLSDSTCLTRKCMCCPAGTVGLYKEPVAILDFASLYPSIYR